jgi:flap endonuclease-1
MGIKHLNKFFRTECGNSIKVISIAELSGKKIAVDISIYMYKYESNEALIENMYLMLATFRQYNIIPIFIFDGKPPTEKKALLEKRKIDKKSAEKEYNILKQKLEMNNTNNEEKQELISNMDSLKKRFIYINREKIDQVKSLIRAYGATYYDAPGEADELCALLVLKNKVWACLSEDMDMFVYGCTRVIRYLSLFNHTAILYNTKEILEKLSLTQKEFREICVLSGTDYNIQNCNNNLKIIPNLYETFKMFNKYKKEKEKENENKNSKSDFYEWLKINSDYITDYELLQNIYNIFDLKNIDFKIFETIKIVNTPINCENIKTILKIDGFIFPPV